MSTSEMNSTNPADFATDFHLPIGPPGWSQLIYVPGGSNPYYVPNPPVISAGIWLLCCIVITIWVALAIRRDKTSGNPITQSLSGWRYRLAMTFAVIAFSWAIFDDTYRLINTWVEQRLFLAQFIFEFFWDLARIALLLSIYDLFFHLMREAPLGNGRLGRMHFWRYKDIKIASCSALVLLAFLMTCLRIAYLSARVFHPPTAKDQSYLQYDRLEDVAVILCYIFDVLYFLAGLEALVVASILLSQQERKNGAGSKAVYIYNLILVAIPLFLAATFTLISTCIRQPPDVDLGGSFGPPDGVAASLAAVQFTAIILNGAGVVLPLGGMVMVAKRADASMDRIGRLSPDSLDMVLVGRDSEQIPPHVRPPSSNYDEPQSWGGSTAA